MTDLQTIDQRLARLESQVAPMAESARALSELRDELAPRVNEAVHALIAELADVEADFQIEDLAFLLKKSMRNVRNLSFALDQLKNLIDFTITAEPLMKSSVPQVIFFLDELEQKGVFRLLNLGIEVLKQIGTTYSEEQMQQIGTGLVRLLGIVHKLTMPEALDLLERAADVPARVDLSTVKPVGTWGLLGALSDHQVK
ncbi:MAG: hypothetical protein AMJ54_11030, partial [Deltaproteobacteria bacterium SG8_13]